ncbi:hypothetical protein GGR56DRAFT_669960 [Xylariaceae sp. FL0804]|nr:hypothetical protein GGR56DRAFT_669960 [Xylariaceae sp. FL0804]
MSRSRLSLQAAPSITLHAAAHGAEAGAVALLAPVPPSAIRCQQLLDAFSTALYLRCYLIALQAPAWCFLATKSALFMSSLTCRWAGLTLWNTTSVRRLRKKLEYEFFTWILGSGGNNVCLVVFWPGWWLMVSIVLMTWICTG